MTAHKKLAKITSTVLGVESHGILTCSLLVDYGGSTQWIGGYALDCPGAEGGRVGTAYGMEFVRRVLLACGVDSWERLVGRTIFVLTESERSARVIGIAPLPTERGKTFVFEDIEPLAAVTA